MVLLLLLLCSLCYCYCSRRHHYRCCWYFCTYYCRHSNERKLYFYIMRNSFHLQLRLFSDLQQHVAFGQLLLFLCNPVLFLIEKVIKILSSQKLQKCKTIIRLLKRWLKLHKILSLWSRQYKKSTCLNQISYKRTVTSQNVWLNTYKLVTEFHLVRFHRLTALTIII